MEKKEVLRYRLCTNCSTIGKRRNRDVNASKNMLTLLNCSIHGLERPKYLCCPWKQYEKHPLRSRRKIPQYKTACV